MEIFAELQRREAGRQIDKYFLDHGARSREFYPKHIEFFKAGSTHKLRLFIAGNRVGKTFAAAFELACHLTGEYPEWWEGKRFTSPNHWWVCGVDHRLVRGELQMALLGAIGSFGTGMIPTEHLDFDSLKDAKKADTAIGLFRVMHKTGVFSSVEFKSYESGRGAFQSAKVNVWLDEEPPLSIFTECLLRTMDTGSGDRPILMMTFTPLLGLSETVLNFLESDTMAEGEILSKEGKRTGKYVVRCGWADVPHLSEEDKAVMLASIPPWARDARMRGIPQMGSGAIFPIPWSEVSCKRFPIPEDWKRTAGMDVGNRTAALWFAQDPNTGKWFGYHEYYREGELPAVHVQSISGPGSWVPLAIDHAAHGRSQIDGQNLFQMYADLGLTLHNANKAVETGLYLCWELLATGQVKFFDDLEKTREEYLIYRKDEKGKVVKSKDEMMDCFRYAMMTGRDLAVNKFDAMPKTHAVQYQVPTQYRPQSIITRR